MRELAVYRAERDAGLAEKLRASNSVACCAQANPAPTTQFPAYLTQARQSVDLFPLQAILVTTGWNLNDDVFDRGETWAGRKTPEDKPFNYEHDCADIIGHITGNAAVGVDLQPLAENLTIDELPARFHLLTSAVLYKVWDKDDLQTRMNRILAEVAEGQWFVSMEAIFYGFDYALLEQSGAAKVVARTEDSAFLTQHLRAYGGSGTYQGLRIGRLLRNVIFSGKGLVRKPANPESVIFKDFLSLGYATLTKEKPMPETDKQVADLKAEVEKLQAQLRDNDVKVIKARAEQAEKSAAEAVADRDTALKAKTAAEEQTKALAGEIATLKSELETAKAERAQFKGELDQIVAARTLSERTEKVISTLKLSADAAKKFVDASTGLSTEQFDTQLASLANIPAAKTTAQEVLSVVKVEPEVVAAGVTTDAGKFETLRKTIENYFSSEVK